MTDRAINRRNAGLGNVKVGIAAAAVAATVAGWALLPNNDPQGSVASAADGGRGAITAPGAVQPQQPSTTAPNANQPQLGRGRGRTRPNSGSLNGGSTGGNSDSSGSTTQPFSRSRSSR